MDHVRQLDQFRQTVFYVGLAELVQPTLVKSTDYGYAVRAIEMCWDWIEQRNVSGLEMFCLYHNEDDYGVEPAMSVEHDPLMWNTWGCISRALLYTAYCAYLDEGKTLPETVEGMGSPEIMGYFMDYFHAVVGDSELPELFESCLLQLPEDQLTQSIVREKLSDLALEG